ncbi:polypeptide N-acetylgalactosaminyltransferase 5 [Caerostris extrusa]|uniref:Polypeptide N-acetylgalactosaminyltransferase 5 n=1 Tax=Caerostris extrusa TaxID=172846 RepID=A0AAV4XBH2_CAEEX|nr:polypeptide N-acetylgalactosaminyltransferase 5 [Caerostris extrusa]
MFYDTHFSFFIVSKCNEYTGHISLKKDYYCNEAMENMEKKNTFNFSSLMFPFFLTLFILLCSQYNLVEKNSPENKIIKKSKKQLEYIDKRGIHVIVGHYIGNELPWNPTPNLTDEIINHNGYSPIPNAGANGDAYFYFTWGKEKQSSFFLSISSIC